MYYENVPHWLDHTKTQKVKFSKNDEFLSNCLVQAGTGMVRPGTPLPHKEGI